MIRMQIFDENRRLVSHFQGRYRLIETKSYEFQIIVEDRIVNGVLQIDGVSNENGDIRTITLNRLSKRPFINCLGIFTISYNDEVVAEIDVITTKLNSKVACQLFEYVYKYGQDIFDSSLNKQRNYKSLLSSNSDLSLLNYIAIIKELLNILIKNFPKICNRPLYKISKENRIKPYDSKNINSKSIEWILSNLDELHYNNLYDEIEGSFPIEDTYAIAERILTEEQVFDFNVYENRIIVGLINSVGIKINLISRRISSILNEDLSMDSEYASFNSLKRTILRNELSKLNEIQNLYRSVKKMYRNQFSSVSPIDESPKLTNKFHKEKHYYEIYKVAVLFKKSTLSSDGVHIVLGIKNLDRLYELYNLFRFIEFYRTTYGFPVAIEKENDDIAYVVFKNDQATYRIFNQLQIRKHEESPHYPWIKLFLNSSLNTHFTPDLVRAC